MKAISYKPISEKEFRKKYSAEEMTYEEYIEMDKEEFEKRLTTAQGLYLGYTERLTKTDGDRDAIARIRDEIRTNEDFWRCGKLIDEMTDGNMNWINAILRSEARRIQRSSAEEFERRERERIAAIEAEKRAEKEQMESLSGFGMF